MIKYGIDWGEPSPEKQHRRSQPGQPTWAANLGSQLGQPTSNAFIALQVRIAQNGTQSVSRVGYPSLDATNVTTVILLRLSPAP